MQAMSLSGLIQSRDRLLFCCCPPTDERLGSRSARLFISISKASLCFAGGAAAFGLATAFDDGCACDDCCCDGSGAAAFKFDCLFAVEGRELEEVGLDMAGGAEDLAEGAAAAEEAAEALLFGCFDERCDEGGRCGCCWDAAFFPFAAFAGLLAARSSSNSRLTI